MTNLIQVYAEYRRHYLNLSFYAQSVTEKLDLQIVYNILYKLPYFLSFGLCKLHYSTIIQALNLGGYLPTKRAWPAILGYGYRGWGGGGSYFRVWLYKPSFGLIRDWVKYQEGRTDIPCPPFPLVTPLTTSKRFVTGLFVVCYFSGQQCVEFCPLHQVTFGNYF